MKVEGIVHLKPSWFVRNARTYQDWCNITECRECGMLAKVEDQHTTDPCWRCGNTVIEKVGRWRNGQWEVKR